MCRLKDDINWTDGVLLVGHSFIPMTGSQQRTKGKQKYKAHKGSKEIAAFTILLTQENRQRKSIAGLRYWL